MFPHAGDIDAAVSEHVEPVVLLSQKFPDSVITVNKKAAG